MLPNLVEDWCNDALDISFRELHAGRGWGLPTVHLDVDFVALCLMGWVSQTSLVVRAIGNSSILLEILFQGPDGRVPSARQGGAGADGCALQPRGAAARGFARALGEVSYCGRVTHSSGEVHRKRSHGNFAAGAMAASQRLLNGVAAKGRTVFVSGMIGWDEQGKLVASDFAGQTRQALKILSPCWRRLRRNPAISCG